MQADSSARKSNKFCLSSLQNTEQDDVFSEIDNDNGNLGI